MSWSRLRFAWVAGLLVLTVHDAGRAQSPVPEPPPRAIVREVGHDFGPVEARRPVSHSFIVHNAGEGPLRILKVEASPGVTSRFTDTVPPGGIGRVTVNWEPSGDSGEVKADVVVHLSDPKRPRVTLVLNGVIRRSIGVEPSPDVFVNVFPDETAERRVAIVNHETRPLAVTGLRPAGEHFTARIETIDAGRRYDIVVTVPRGLRPGRYIEDLFVDTDHPQLGPLHLAVNAFVKDAMYATPEVIDFGDVSLERVRASESAPWLSQSSTLRKRVGDFAITSISSDIEGLRVDRSPSGRSGVVGLLVTLDRRHLQAGDLEGSIRIQTDDKAFPVLVLPVRGRIR